MKVFIRVTLCETDQEIFLNVLKIESFHRVSGYTKIRTGKKALDVMETPEEIMDQMTGVQK